jgi:hypothetical protein
MADIAQHPQFVVTTHLATQAPPRPKSYSPLQWPSHTWPSTRDGCKSIFDESFTALGKASHKTCRAKLAVHEDLLMSSCLTEYRLIL